MGMYDESWCAGCGAGMHYTADESAMCGNCTSGDILTFVKVRIEELTQRRVELREDRDFELDDYLAGCIDAYDIVRMQLEN